MSFVLRQIHPKGKSARADDANAAELAIASIEGNVVIGDYLEWSDPNANFGMGDDKWTTDLAKAKRFPSFTVAMECWKAQSTLVPQAFRWSTEPSDDSLQRHRGGGPMMEVWTIYEHPLDYPDSYVARKSVVGVGSVTMTHEMFTADTLDELRELLPLGLYPVTRWEQDDPNIVEVWL